MRKVIFVSATEVEHGGVKEINGLPVFQIGIGKINAAYNMANLLQIHKPTFVINFGSCGNLKNYKVGEILEVGVVHNDIDCRPYAQRYGITPEDNIGSIKLSTNGINLFTTDIIYDNKRTDYTDSYLEMIDKCDIVDMECYSLAYVCKKMNVGFRSYKWVSDSGEVDKWEENAALGFNNFKERIHNLVNLNGI